MSAIKPVMTTQELVATSTRLPKVNTPVLIVWKGRWRIGELCWETPGHEESFTAYRYWDDPYDNGQHWQWDDVTHWASLPAIST